MDHEAMKEQVFALYDGELTGSVRRTVEVHLEQCEECRRTYASWERAAKIFFQPPHIQASKAFVEHVLNQIEAVEQPARASTRRQTVRWLIPALGLAAVLLLVMGSMRQPISVEALLLSEGQENGQSQLVFASEKPSVETVLDAILDGQR